jgi:hypothetical protein
LLRFYFNFFNEDEFDRIVSSLDIDNLQDVPGYSVGVKSCPMRQFNVNDKIKEFGKCIYQELLIYETGTLSKTHHDLGYGSTLPWDTSAILFCNDNYSGGEFYFDKLNMSMKLPKNTLMVFPTGKGNELYTHGVNEVTEGERITAIFRFTNG